MGGPRGGRGKRPVAPGESVLPSPCSPPACALLISGLEPVPAIWDPLHRFWQPPPLSRCGFEYRQPSMPDTNTKGTDNDRRALSGTKCEKRASLCASQ